MTFIVILIALLIERFFDWSHLRYWSWYHSYQQAIIQRLSFSSPYALLAMVLLPVLIVVYLLDLTFSNLLYGFSGFLFDLIVLLYCLGPQSLWADGYGLINSLASGNLQDGAKKMHMDAEEVSAEKEASSFHHKIIDYFFIAANKRIFAVVFWFFLLGPVGAFLYRLVSLSAEKAAPETNPAFMSAAAFVQAVLDWLPVRLFTIVFALGGHFVQVLSAWRQYALAGVQTNDVLLKECGAAALGQDANKLDGSVEKEVIGLLDRSFVIILVILGLLELVL